MILYHALTTYHFLNCVVHRQLFHPNEKATLMIDANDLPRLGASDYGKIIEAGLFDRILRFPSSQINDSDTIGKLDPFFKNLLVPDSIQDFNKIYVAGIHSDFAVYLAAQQIGFSAFEDGSGLLSRQHEFIIGLKLNFPARYRLLDRFGLADFSCEQIDRIFIHEDAQLPSFRDPRTESFDVASEFRRLNKPQQTAILDWFGVSRIDPTKLENRQSLLLGQSLSANRFMSYESECRMLKKIVATYATESELLIKPHPDNLLPLETMFPDAYVFPASFPLELIPLVFPKRLSRLIEIDSAGTRAIHFFFDQKVRLYWNYLKSYRLESEYRAVLTDPETAVIGKPIVTIGIDRYHFDALADQLNPDKPTYREKWVELLPNPEREPDLSMQNLPACVILDAEKSREINQDQIQALITECLRNNGCVIVINNLRGKSVEKSFPILNSVDCKTRFISDESEFGLETRLILYYGQRNPNPAGKTDEA